MKWEQYFARRTQWMRRNTVREFLKYTDKPGMISFAGGLPGPEVFPVEEVRLGCEEVARKYGTRALQYGASEGISELRAHLAEPLRGIGVTAENVLITSGAQQALELIGRVLLEENDEAFVENPTYLALLSAWRAYGIRFRDIDSAERVSMSAKSAPARSGIIYCIPNFQNPSGTSLSIRGRNALLERATQERIPIVEDDPYGQLRYEGEALPSLLKQSGTMDGPVIHVGTFSKVLAPGFRIGWIVAARPLLDKLVQAKQAMDLHTSTFNQYLAWELIERGVLDRQVPRIREVYRRKRDIMIESLEKEMPDGVKWTTPQGGMFLLMTLPENQNGRTLAERGLQAGVAVVPGEEFHIHGGENTCRLNFSYPSEEEIQIGIAKLAGVFRATTAPNSREVSAAHC